MLYFATCTRPYIAYAVGVLSHFCEIPTELHWSTVKRIFRYLKEAEECGVVFDNCKAFDEKVFCGYSDYDCDGSFDQKSTRGSTLFYYVCLDSWKSRKQGLVALSSTEAEMIALVEAFKEQKSVIKPFEECSVVKRPWILFFGNQAVVKVARDTGYSRRAKHIELCFFAIQDFAPRQVITLPLRPSEETCSDVITTPLLPNKHEQASIQLTSHVLL